MYVNLPPGALRLALGCLTLIILFVITFTFLSPLSTLRTPNRLGPTSQVAVANVSTPPSLEPLNPWWTTEQLEPRFAYAQYATNLDYLCNSLINFHLLHRYGAKHDFVLIIPNDWSEGTSKQARAIANVRKHYPRIILRSFDVISLKKGDATWRDSLTKFHSFALTEWTRVLAFDSDSLVLNSMDHYFLSPMAPVAFPRAYWLTERNTDIAKQVLGSHVMLIEPNEDRYHKVIDEGLNSGEFDMEVINNLFKDSAMILPHRRLALLTGEFRSRNHSKYLAPDENEEWNAMGEVSRSVLVHFSDWPLPKPWMPRTQKQWEDTMPKCLPEDVETPDRPKCADQMMWTGFYTEYTRWKDEICPILYE